MYFSFTNNLSIFDTCSCRKIEFTGASVVGEEQKLKTNQVSAAVDEAPMSWIRLSTSTQFTACHWTSLLLLTHCQHPSIHHTVEYHSTSPHQYLHEWLHTSQSNWLQVCMQGAQFWLTWFQVYKTKKPMVDQLGITGGMIWLNHGIKTLLDIIHCTYSRKYGESGVTLQYKHTLSQVHPKYVFRYYATVSVNYYRSPLPHLPSYWFQVTHNTR